MRVVHLPFPGPGCPLRKDDVHVWLARLEPCPAGVADHLTAEESQRAAGYQMPRVREQFVAARGVLREVLARYVPERPREIGIGVDPGGKPLLTAAAGLHFNVSHSAGWGLFAVSRVRVGVDLEPVRAVENADGLVERFFAVEERSCYAELPAEEKPGGFLRGWTCKEAVLKAVGVGMRRMDECVVEMDPRKPARVLRWDRPTEEWELETWGPLDGFTAAVAYETGAGAVG